MAVEENRFSSVRAKQFDWNTILMLCFYIAQFAKLYDGVIAAAVANAKKLLVKRHRETPAHFLSLARSSTFTLSISSSFLLCVCV